MQTQLRLGLWGLVELTAFARAGIVHLGMKKAELIFLVAKNTFENLLVFYGTFSPLLLVPFRMDFGPSGPQLL